MASFMNLALVAGDLQTKYLNLLFHVDRSAYGELAALVLTATAIGIAVPLTLILMFGSRVGTAGTR